MLKYKVNLDWRQVDLKPTALNHIPCNDQKLYLWLPKDWDQCLYFVQATVNAHDSVKVNGRARD